MTYIDYLNQFWKTQQSVEFSSNEVYLYFFLLNECNIRGWENPFACSNRRIVLSTGISEPTVIDCRNRLQQKGLILFEGGKRKAQSPIYYLNDLSKPLSKTLSINLSKTLSKNPHIYKTKDNKTKDKIESNDSTKNFTPPTVDDVKNYCDERSNSVSAEKFVNFYTSKGWMVGKNKMKDWKAAVRTWEKNENDTNKQNITPSTKADRDAEFARHIAAKLGRGD